MKEKTEALGCRTRGREGLGQKKGGARNDREDQEEKGF